MSSGKQRLLDFLDNQGVEYELIPHRLDYTAQRTAADTHTPGREFAKPVIVNVDGYYTMLVLRAPDLVDFASAREIFDCDTATLATEGEIAEIFDDCEVGAEPALGNLYGLRVVVDRALSRDKYITFNAGTHHEAIRMKYEDFQRLAHPDVVDVAYRRAA